ncbi:unnamed protein product (macronuclear) [Paramecium tetraurelia]|uniref:Calponin-homology (CH) domain-containing protein n=1 Tax=Paramecium tetraurelia TaxID=5888 RepID=A0CVU7_PARTE|nr:uncharacterized protein GSPATT00001116001 [Paramecium tetraurelia]CAK74914.1 unnamed protein product [Paramecium tetraurelia]|eukprot:XP_001442311.1 hypothetical protein (macronuclear) [Paramecium tetraurelia strain d4-2]
MEQEIIDWANTFENTKSIDDLKTGVALCQIISKELFQDKRQCELKIRVIKCTKQDYQSCIRNLTFALALLEESQQVQVKHLTGQMLYQNPLKIFQILQQFYRSKSVSSASSKPPKAPQKQDEPLFYVDENLVQPNQSIQMTYNEELIANKYKMIKPNSPYQETNNNQQRSQTHQTEYAENSNRSKPQNQSNDSISNLTPIKSNKDSYNQKLKYELQVLENQIAKEQQNLQQKNNRECKSKHSQESKSQHDELNQDQNFNQQQQQQNSITNEQKQQLIEWLKQIRLIKSNAQGLEYKLPKICKNGVIFFDLINRLTGRDEVLKGALRNPKSLREIKHNYRRVLEYLKQLEKMSYKYLSSEQQLVDGDEGAFWGLMHDIKVYYTNCGNAAITNCSQSVDASLRQTQQQQQVQQNTQLFQQNSQSKLQSQITRSQKKQLHKQSFADTQLEITIDQPQQSKSVKPSTANRSPVGPYSRIHNMKQEYDSVNRSLNSLMKKSQIGSQNGTPVNQSLQHSRNFSSSKQQQKARSTSISKNCVTREMELYVQTYFKQKGLYNNENLFTDPIRNGNYIIQLIEQPVTKNNFKSILEVEFNVDSALQATKAIADAGNLPAWIGKIDKSSIMQLDKSAMGLYWWLLKQQTKKIEPNINQFTLPYRQEEIDQLKIVTLHFAREYTSTIQNFNDLIYQCQTGILLCQIETEIFQQKITPIYTKPIGEKQCIANIRKALDYLKGKQIGQRFVWSEKLIYEGDQLIILGLFEDLRRYFDGLPQRQGDSYFEDGPYLKKSIFQSKGNQKVEQIIQQEPYSLIQKESSFVQPQQVNKKLIFDDPPQFEWLNNFGFKINWNNEVLEEFKDGNSIIICTIVQRLENIQFKGIQQKPNTNAGCLVNIRKAFSVLKEKLDMPLELVIEQEKLLKGDKEYIIKLLTVFKNIYKNKLKSK